MLNTEIKNARKALKLTQKKFALLLGVSVRTVQMWESGERNISKPLAFLIQEKLKADDDNAFENKENTNPNLVNEPQDTAFSKEVLKKRFIKNYPELFSLSVYEILFFLQIKLDELMTDEIFRKYIFSQSKLSDSEKQDVEFDSHLNDELQKIISEKEKNL